MYNFKGSHTQVYTRDAFYQQMPHSLEAISVTVHCPALDIMHHVIPIVPQVCKIKYSKLRQRLLLTLAVYVQSWSVEVARPTFSICCGDGMVSLPLEDSINYRFRFKASSNYGFLNQFLDCNLHVLLIMFNWFVFISQISLI